MLSLFKIIAEPLKWQLSKAMGKSRNKNKKVRPFPFWVSGGNVAAAFGKPFHGGDQINQED